MMKRLIKTAMPLDILDPTRRGRKLVQIQTIHDTTQKGHLRGDIIPHLLFRIMTQKLPGTEIYVEKT